MSNVLLTAQEVGDLKRMCNDPFLELGMTLRPKHLECFECKVATHNMKVIVLFEKHEHAVKWNEIHEAQIRKGGHLATITLTALVGMLGGIAGSTNTTFLVMPFSKSGSAPIIMNLDR